jgi:O-antigen/teichoic acid export membrane protein
MARSLKSNIFYNVINAAVSFLFPIITLPYVSRILAADGLGQIEFYNSIINYIVLATSLGIPLYAVREVARVRDNKTDFNKTTAEIYILNNVLSGIGYLVVLALCMFYPKVNENWLLFVILSLTIGFNSIGATWFFQAIEDFKFIAIRSVIVKVICLVCVFIFVKQHSDILKYALISVSINIGNTIFNVYKLRKDLDFSNLKYQKLNVFRHIKPASSIFVLNLSTSLYNYLNVFILGLLAGSDVVGYFAVPLRFVTLCLGITSIISTVLIPRFSNMISIHDSDGFKVLGNRIYHLINIMVIPLAVFFVIVAKQLVLLFFGEGFIRSVLVTQLIAPILFLIGNTGMLGLQFLFPQGKERIVVICTFTGAFICCALNLILIPQFSENGAAIATLAAEFGVYLLMSILGHKYFPMPLFDKNYIQFFIATVPMAIIMMLVVSFNIIPIISVSLCVFLGFATYAVVLALLKNETLNDIKSLIRGTFISSNIK